ncbi:serine/threonine-protein kinase Nek4-like [Copidosoma floridanum]|uniref:serine/threonine-protein kinase Nek4-like n=1 Tax=Copidosoma floridanum TaxID=29053 RepID=UPI0006C95D5A|nr:serine/threonine-protein kinase Nek4-like [Copidosoma floridanum]
MSANLQKANFEFKALLGQGSFGQVYLVKRLRDGKEFVIKQQEKTVNSELITKMTTSEVQCLQVLRHPNIVSYYGAWQESDNFYILLEYAPRGTLKDLLNQRTEPLTEKDSLYLFAQVVLGVHHIHSKNILHRDLKPENIMLTGRMGDIVKIGDFGLSRELQGYDNKSHAGSYYYISPEMLKREPYDFKSDIWSMGIIFYEMLSKELAFPAKDITEITDMICKEEQKRLFTKVEVSVETEIIVYKMLLRDPDKRPSTRNLLLNPSMVRYIAKVYLNLGRAYAVPPEELSVQMFLPYIKPPFQKT